MCLFFLPQSLTKQEGQFSNTQALTKGQMLHMAQT